MTLERGIMAHAPLRILTDDQEAAVDAAVMEILSDVGLDVAAAD